MTSPSLNKLVTKFFQLSMFQTIDFSKETKMIMKFPQESSFSTYGPGLVSRDLTFPKTVQKVSEHNSKMPNLRNVRECLLFGFEENPLNDEEFILLYDMNISKNPDFPYWQYDPFDLDGLCDDECKAEFPFLKNNIHLLKDVLQVPEEVVCHNRLVVDGIEDLCVLLKRFAYPICYSNMCPRSATPSPLLSIITNAMLMSFTRLELPIQTVGDLLMGQSAEFVDWKFTEEFI